MHVHVFAIRVKNGVDPEQMASSGSTVFSKRKKSKFSMTWVKPRTRVCKIYALTYLFFILYGHNYANQNLNQVMTSLIIVFIIFLETISIDCKPIFKFIMLGKHITH